ncbi:prolyl 3-hydroxylase 3 [Spea bombifrons]|uniref:prolyl 3-hydroxylase 3 n=1 Tax=Spea bombifrons TaxID=233779 RepID=UPI00234998D5|nr:prolyl 3-hydroxylase 3 [Spea bombifrons]
MRGPLLLLFGGLFALSGIRTSPLPPPDLLLWNGISLFSREDWLGARGQLWGALRSLSELQGVKVRCGEECGLRGSWGPHLEDAVLKRADCLLGCERLRLGEPSLYRLTQETEKVFSRGQLYNYLQVVHYKLEELDEAAAAAFTFYVRNPFHEQIQDDLQRYRKMKNVGEQSFRDLEQSQCQALFSQAVSLLSDGKLRAAALRLEDSLTACLSELDSCRSLCEGTRELENEVHRDLSEVIAEYYVSVLQCRQMCVLRSSSTPGLKPSKEDAVLSCLSLLMDTYTKLEDWDSAAEIAHSLLLFNPQNETTRERLRGCEERLGGKSVGKAREIIASYVHRTLSEKKLLYYAMENLNISFGDPDSWTPEEIIPESLRERVRKEREAEGQKGASLPYDDVTVTFTPHEMNGTARVTLDGVINEDECRMLVDLAQMAGGSGSGFRGRRSPHTPRERIQGLTVLRAIQMALAGSADLSHSRLLYRSSERARILAQSYFGTEKLHFSYTHLVCRSAIEGEQEGRSDLSHPVHADNCILDPEEKECWREPPAYVHRDVSGLLYLNDDFQGGDLFFTEPDAETVTAEVRPRCGRLVLFSSGGENAHGVRAVTRGTRCAVALWFTKSAEHAEQERSEAQDLLLGTANATQSKDGEETKTGRETASNGEEPERPSGRRQKKRESRKFTDEL